MKMATAAVNRPPLASEGPNSTNPHAHVNHDMTNAAHQDPGLHSTSQDPGSLAYPQHPVFARPVFYVNGLPLPPFHHYQWPMPLSYNPFAGFLGMGYGMVLPPFPPPPYLESPAYIVPHPQVQPVRLLHPQAHGPGAPVQNLYQTRRIRLPHTTPFRETVNSEVQTEAPHRGVGGSDEGCPLVSSDSGRATASNSPSSLSSSSQKQGSAEVETYMLTSTDAKEQVNRPGKHGYNMNHPMGMNDVQSAGKATQKTLRCKDDIVQVPSLIPPCRNTHCNMWLVSSQDGMVPVCSSSQREDEVKERRISVPDILSWGGGTPQTMKMAAKVLPQNETEQTLNALLQSPAETENDPVVVSSAENVDTKAISSLKDSEMVFKILRLHPSVLEPISLPTRDVECVELVVRPHLTNGDGILQSVNAPQDETENGSEPHEDTTEITPNRISLSRSQRKMNASVWSVESLAPFIPPKEWLQQNSIFEPEVIVELEKAENGLSTGNDSPIVKFNKGRKRSCRFSSSDSVPVSESCLIFSTPAEKPSPPKNPDLECETEVSEIKGTEQGQSMVPSEKDPLTSFTPLQGTILTACTDKDMDENGSSEPEANQSPNQDTLMINEHEEKSPCSHEREETCLLHSASEDKISSTCQMTLQNSLNVEVDCVSKDGEMRHVELCVPTTDQRMAHVSPSKGNLVDCAIQCTELQQLKCLCEELKGTVAPNRRRSSKLPDLKKANDAKAEVFCMQKNSKRNGQWRTRGQDKHSSQQEACSGYSGKPGKLKGGSGRNPRY